MLRKGPGNLRRLRPRKCGVFAMNFDSPYRVLTPTTPGEFQQIGLNRYPPPTPFCHALDNH